MFFNKKKSKLYAPVNGELIMIETVSDPVFAEKMMGEGFAVKPSDGAIYAPIEGEITNVFPTKHAISVITKSGIEVLIHMGLDTVELAGEPFDVQVKAGDKVTENTLLANIDLAKLAAAEKEADILVVFTNGDQLKEIKIDSPKTVKASESIGEIQSK